MTKEEMSLREHLRRAGQVKSDKKAKASRENGKKGGRPRKEQTCQECGEDVTNVPVDIDGKKYCPLCACQWKGKR